nr:MAG TPA: hypothetical protein [Bacteriophage sp.]
MDINSLKDNLNKSLADVSTKGIPSANFEPVWINNITRLNAQNFNARMYPTIASYITGYGNAVFEGSNEQLSNLLSILPGYKVTDTSTSEIHNLDSDLSSTNEADGAYQAVFGRGNISQPTVTGQFLIGTYSDPYTDTLFAVGNGSNDNQKSNALEVTLDGTLKSSKINVTENITAKYITLTEVITDSSNDKYAATKKYVFDKVKTESDRAIAAENTLTTNLNNEISRAKAEESSIRAIASSAFHFKGTKDSYNDLPKSGNTQGDVWQVGDKEYAWNGTEWVELGFNIDLSEYVKTTEMNTALSKKQNYFASVYIPGSKATSIVTASTPSLQIYCKDSDSMLRLEKYAVSLDVMEGVKLSVDKDCAKFYTESKNMIPVFGVATPMSKQQLDSMSFATADDEPYQAANKKYVDDSVYTKQDTLISGTNIKTINNQSLLGSGNITIEGGGGTTITVDAELSETSTNPVQNKIITEALNNKQGKITNKTDLRLNSVLLGNANVILSGDYNPTTGGTGYMLKIGGDSTSDKVRITNIDDGIAADNAVNKKQLDAKQDKFATVANVDSTQTVTIADTLTITTNPNLLADQIISTKALFLQGSSTSGVRLSKTVLEGSADFDATAGYLRVRDNPLADDFAVNKKYVDDSVNTKLSATTNKYSISWDDTNEAIKITFHE